MNSKKNSADLLLSNLKNDKPNQKAQQNRNNDHHKLSKNQEGVASFIQPEIVVDNHWKQHLTTKNPIQQVARSVSKEELLRNRNKHIFKEDSLFVKLKFFISHNFFFYLLWVFVLALPAALTFSMLYLSPNIRSHFLTNDSLQILWISSLYAISLLFMTVVFFLVRNFSLLLAKSVLSNNT